ncbi:MAG: T9SS type A sorting domain-containing protein [Pedobacter sp.]
MKKLLLSLLFISGFAASGFGQNTWYYDFGTGTSATYSTNAISTSFLPAPQTNGGTAMARVSNTGGVIKLTNPGDINAVGTGASIVAPENAAVSKISIYDFANASSTASLKFRFKFNANDAVWYIFTGNGDSFSNANAFASAEVSTGLQITVSGGTASTENRISGGWSSSSGISTSQFSPNTTYTVEIYINKQASGTSTYVRGGTTYTINNNRYHLWIDGVQIGANITGGGLTTGSTIDSFMFYGVSSAGNAGELFIDDIAYANYVTETVLPIELSSFSAKANLQNIDLAWTTASEKDNSHFDILRSGDGKTFTKIGDVKGNGTTDIAKNYTFIDKNALPGVNYYQLKQVDNNGTSALSKVEAVKSNVAASNLKVSASKQDGTVKLTVFAANEGNATFKIYDLNGRKITERVLNLSKGYSNVSVPFNGGNGLHIASLTTATETVTQKFIQ